MKTLAEQTTFNVCSDTMAGSGLKYSTHRKHILSRHEVSEKKAQSDAVRLAGAVIGQAADTELCLGKEGWFPGRNAAVQAYQAVINTAEILTFQAEGIKKYCRHTKAALLSRK